MLTTATGLAALVNAALHILDDLVVDSDGHDVSFVLLSLDCTTQATLPTPCSRQRLLVALGSASIGQGNVDARQRTNHGVHRINLKSPDFALFLIESRDDRNDATMVW